MTSYGDYDMTLIYQGKGENIPHVPAYDLDDLEVAKLAASFNLSEDDFIALVTSRGLYSVQKPTPKTSKKEVIPDLEEDES
jgi:hypothetical protein